MKKKDPEIARLEKAAVRAKERLQVVKDCKKYDIKIPPTSRQITAQIKQKVLAIPKETRQLVVNAWHKYTGTTSTVGEMAKECGVSVEDFCFIIELNTKIVKHGFVNTETV